MMMFAWMTGQLQGVYNQEEVCQEISYGDGWVVLNKMYSSTDIEMAKDHILIHKIR